MLTDTCRVLTGIADVSVDRRQLLGDKFGGSFDISGRVSRIHDNLRRHLSSVEGRLEDFS